MQLLDLIKDHIKTHGPLSIADYVRFCLQHPEHGYYIKDSKQFGEEGDFITSPEISQVFGELIGLWIGQMWHYIGKPQTIHLVELGPGRGLLMEDMLRALSHFERFMDAVQIHMVDINPHLIKLQKKALKDLDVLEKTTWHESFDTVPEGPILLVANEFFDALPVHQIQKENDRLWYERCVALDEKGQLCYTMSPNPSKLGLMIARDHPDGTVRELCPQAVQIVTDITKRIQTYKGAALIVDYGYTDFKRGETLQALKEHKFHPLLSEPGSADISAHVDFGMLARAVTACEAKLIGPVTQKEFLEELGIETRMNKLLEGVKSQEEKNRLLRSWERLTNPTQMGTLFKVMGILKQ